MPRDSSIVSSVHEAQQRIFRLALRFHGLTIKTISLDSGIPYDTLRSYANGRATMPITALLYLVGVLPDELLSHLLAPVGKQISDGGDCDGGDLDALGCETAGFVADYVQAKSDGVVTPIERAKLASRAARIADRASKVRAA